MIEYLRNPDMDMHRDMAAECFCIPVNEVTKKLRYFGKNCFVFPQFYGSFWRLCAPNLWEARNEPTASGKPVIDYLRKAGITRLGDLQNPKKGAFAYYIQQVEDRFWNQRFQVYNQWRKRWLKNYERRGFLDSFTGFRCWGPMRRNQVINYPVQGSAFHCLLQSMVLLNTELKSRGLETLLVGQIHDSIVADVPTEELGEVLRLTDRILTQDIRNLWDWVTIPLEVEVEVTPEGGSWWEKKPLEKEDWPE